MVQRGLQRFWSNNVLDKPYLEAAITWRFLLLFQWIRSCLFSRCSPSYLLPSAHERKSSPRARKRKRGSKWGKFTEKADTGAWQSIRVCIRRNNPSWNRRHGRFPSHVCTGAATQGRFLSDAGQPEVRPFSFGICLDDTKFVLPRVFTLLETIFPKTWAKPLPKTAKSPLPVDVGRSKTPFHKPPN